MRTGNRKSAPKVKAGRVQKKNNQSPTGCYFIADMPWLMIDRKRPGKGCRHLLNSEQITRFLQLVPNWKELEGHLRAIVLDTKDAEEEMFGWHSSSGVIGICAWPRDFWIETSVKGYEDERLWLEMLDVPCEINRKIDTVTCQFTENTARGHQLLGTLLHEIGHHVDRITTRSKLDACRGEPFAIKYARETAQAIFPKYLREFEI